MLISSKEKITTALYPRQIRDQIRRELIEDKILEAQEWAMASMIVGDLDKLIYCYQVQNNWQKVLCEYDKIVKENA